MSSVIRPKKQNAVDVFLSLYQSRDFLFGKLFLNRTGVCGRMFAQLMFNFCSLSGLKIREEEDQHHQEVLFILLKATKSDI